MAPQGSGSPWIGQLPSYATQPGPDFSSGYGPFLPRPPQVFTEGAFGPFSPILPVPVDQPPPGLPRPQPRRWQPRVGYNLPVGEPGSEGYKLASFSTLTQLANAYSILRTCLDRRKNEIRGLDWDIVLTKDAAKAYRGDRKAMRDFGERRAKAIKWFKKPDPNYNDFASWFFALMEETFVKDALSLYLCPKKARGMGRGLLGSDLDCLWALDGSSIRPLMGLHGERPAPPAPFVQQYEFGVPRADYTMMIDGRDLDEYGLTDDDLRCELRGDQVVYWPYDPRTDSPYGQSLVEKALIPVMTGLRKQAYQLDFFSESTIPAVYITPGEASGVTPNQVRELQDAMNAIAGDINWNFKVIVLPPGSKVLPQKQMEIVDQADEWIASEVAMVCDINPMEIGLLPKVSTVASPFAAREMAQTSRSAHERTSTKPTLAYYTAIFNVILQGICRQDDMRFLFSGMEEMSDQAAMSDMDIKDVQSAIRSIDEVRDERGLVPWDLPETRMPVVFTSLGPLPLGGKNAGLLPATAEAPTAAHAAASGAMGTGKQPRALPAGNSGTGRMNGPVTQRQARRGGALAPAHSTAEGAPGRSGGKPVPKAALAELEALTRHLSKGRDINTWRADHLPGTVMAVIADDLGKGLTPAQCASIAAPMILPRSDYEWLPKASGSQPGQDSQRERLEREYAQQVREAFTAAAAAAAALIAQWAAGTLTVTAAVLASMIADGTRSALRAALEPLWRAAWALAEAEEGAADPDGLAAFLATWGEQVADWVSATDIADVTAALRDLAGMKRKAVIAELLRLLEADTRASRIMVSEITRALNMALLGIWRMLGVTEKAWQTRNDGNVCARCLRNQAQGFIPLSQPFASGLMAPLQHPSCRCRLRRRPGMLAALAGKAARSVPLNGQELWAENPAGGGGRGPVPHAADGTQVWGGVPGSTAGGEPPRWDGSEPVWDADRDHQDGDDGAYGEAAGLGSRPGANWPAIYMDGYWPEGGHGDTQPPVASIGGGERGRPPGPTGKSAKGAAVLLEDAPKAKAATVYAQMRQNFPPAAIAWIKRLKWSGPAEIPLDLIDWDDAGRWAAVHQQAHDDQFAAEIRAGKKVAPSVGVIRPGHRKVRLVDGHHRAMARRKLGMPVLCYVAALSDPYDDKAAFETHSSQVHQGNSPANKRYLTADEARERGRQEPVPAVAGLAVRAADTGRVLMLQRAISDDDPFGGYWEFPGGHAEPGETLLQAAQREWSEETGCAVPRGGLIGRWQASNGIYEGWVLSVESEASVPIFDGRDATWNPDDPHGDKTEAVAWWEPSQLRDNPAIRPELVADLPLVMEALGEMATAGR